MIFNHALTVSGRGGRLAVVFNKITAWVEGRADGNLSNVPGLGRRDHLL